MSHETKGIDIPPRDWRRGVARTLIGVSATIQLLLISSLPLTDLTATELRTLFVLSTLLALSIGSAALLGKSPRAALVALGIASIYCILQIARTGLLKRVLDGIPGVPVGPESLAEALLPFAALVLLPCAFFIAIPLRRQLSQGR